MPNKTHRRLDDRRSEDISSIFWRCLNDTAPSSAAASNAGTAAAKVDIASERVVLNLE
jgi:hypothetical protein